MLDMFTITYNFPSMYPPLCMILIVSMVKDGYENYQHYKSDREENMKMVTTVNH
jgi:hypothetical protein